MDGLHARATGYCAVGSIFHHMKPLGLLGLPLTGTLGLPERKGPLGLGGGLLSLGHAAPPPISGLGSLFAGDAWTGGRARLSLVPAAPPLVTNWQFVRRRFRQLLDNLAITAVQGADGEQKSAGVRSCLNRHYWQTHSETSNSILTGSWGKHTQVRPPRDVDVLFLLPGHVYYRFQKRAGNRQSQLLQEMKEILMLTYGRTTMRGDGQVVVVPFDTAPVEVSPGFRCSDGSIIICDTNDGGRYRTSTAEAEANDLILSDARWNGNTRAFIRMTKCWQRKQNVPLKSFQIERFAIEFLESWSNSRYDLFWYDWMVRDFFNFLISRTNTYLLMPGSGELVWLGSDWLSHVETAHRHAISACENEHRNDEASAGRDWQHIFGASVNVIVS
jgi:hypothetical protein